MFAVCLCRQDALIFGTNKYIHLHAVNIMHAFECQSAKLRDQLLFNHQLHFNLEDTFPNYVKSIKFDTVNVNYESKIPPLPLVLRKLDDFDASSSSMATVAKLLSSLGENTLDDNSSLDISLLSKFTSNLATELLITNSSMESSTINKNILSDQLGHNLIPQSTAHREKLTILYLKNELRINEKTLTNILLNHQWIMYLRSESNLQPKIAVLKSFGFRDKDIRSLIQTVPSILGNILCDS